jgi:uncharacterized protein (DUF2336 family)
MTEEALILQELDLSLRARSRPERLQVLRSVTDLFLHNADRHTDAQVALFDDVLCRLIAYVETRALAQLSQELAPIDTAPPRAVRQLARHDEIVVSGPVLTLSSRLKADDLIEIARTKSQAHLLAIGNRAWIEEVVTDVLVERGDAEVAKAIASNSGARFSKSGFCTLVVRARDEDGLIELVAFRDEISPEQLRGLVANATETVRRRLTAIARPELRRKIDAVVNGIASTLDQRMAAQQRDYAAARELAEAMRHDPALMRARLKQAAEGNDFELSVAVLAALGGVAVPAVERVMIGNDPGGLLLMCKAIDLQWPVVRPILRLHPAGKRATPMQLDRWCEQLTKINPATAARVARFWQGRAGAVQ